MCACTQDGLIFWLSLWNGHSSATLSGILILIASDQLIFLERMREKDVLVEITGIA